MNKAFIFIEILAHFKCNECRKYWSVGDYEHYRIITCPHCQANYELTYFQIILIKILKLISRIYNENF